MNVLHTEEICHVDRFQHGCSRDTGCQGHAARAIAPDLIRQQAQQLIDDAARLGVVVTIEQRPLAPLAMRNYETVATVRRARGAA